MVNNVTKHADRLGFNVMFSLAPSNSRYFSFDYELPLFIRDSHWGLSLAKNAFSVGQDLETLEIEGDSTVLDTHLRTVFIRKRAFQLQSKIGLSLKNSTSEDLSKVLGKDKLTVLTAALEFQSADRWLGGSHAGSISYSTGLPETLGSMVASDENSSRTSQDDGDGGGEFTRINLNYTHWFPLPMNQMIRVHYRSQASSDLLVSLEQVPMGGPNSIRAYPVSEQLMDSASFVNLEWSAKAANTAMETWMQELQFLAYFDYGSGERNSPLANEIANVNLRGIGVGIAAKPFGKYSLRGDIGIPIGSYEAKDGSGAQLYLNLGYIF